mgnify:CR=1 FL=1
MNVTFETVICAWDEKIPALLIRLVNTSLCRRKRNSVQSIDKLRETTELDEFFTYGYGSHHSGATSAFPKEACSSSKAGYSLRHFNPLIHK